MMRGDEVEKFLSEHMKTIFAYALSRVSVKEDAEDLAGDIMLAILQSASRLQDEEAFYGYVWAIAANTYKKFLNKKNRSRDVELDEALISDDDFLDEIVYREEVRALRRELALLSKEYRECTVAYYFDGLSCAQIAVRLDISLEMVKYYLFKTRKILKEGIGMERIFGEKSYKPAEFHFVTIFSGRYNAEYRNLFDRKLPGNILLSAYYAPMTVRELSMELGVSSAYMEDEIALLEKYGLIRALSGGKYQTDLIIFTEAYTSEWHRAAEKECAERMASLLLHLKHKLPLLREAGLIGPTPDDNRVTWGLVWLLMREGYALFEKENEAMTVRDTIYPGANGINYGVDYDEYAGEYSADAFAGYVKLNETHAAAFADFGILPQKNRFSGRSAVIADRVLKGESNGFLLFTKEELGAVSERLREEIAEMKALYEWLSMNMTAIMRMHAPGHMGEMAAHIVSSTLFFRTVGFIGASAVRSGALTIPEDDEPIAFYVYEK